MWATIAGFFLSIALAALANTMVGIDINQISIEKWLFALFFLLFRIKIFLDDKNSFENEKNKLRLQFKLGVVIGIFAWFFWILAAINLNNTDIRLTHLIIAFFISLICLNIQFFPNYEKKHIFWAISNVICIILIMMTKSKLITESLTMGIMTIICFIDFYISKSLNALEDDKEG